MEYGSAIIQKAADLVSQYDHFFAAVKERAASFTGNATSVNRSIEANFEALRVMLEQRKNVLLSEVREEVNTSRENDIFELEAKQRDMHLTLQQLQQLAVHSLLTEDNKCYQQLLIELSEAKQKLKETSDKFQIKFEGFMKPLATKIASYGQVVTGCGNGGDENSTAKHGVNFSQVFATLSSQFEACCQLQATRREVKPFTDDKRSPLSGWFEYSKKLQWRRTTTIPSSGSAVPDFASIIKKLKDNFNNRPTTTTIGGCCINDESLEKWLVPKQGQPSATEWLVPRVDQRSGVTAKWLVTSDRMVTTPPSDDAVTMVTTPPSDEAVSRGFDAIARSDDSLWLARSASDDGLLSKQHSHFSTDMSPWLLQSSSNENETIPSIALPDLQQDYSKWLKPMMEVQPWLTTTTLPSKENDISNWLQGHNWSDRLNEQWLLPRVDSAWLPSGGDSGGDTLSDIFDSTQTVTSFGSSDFELVDDTDM